MRLPALPPSVRLPGLEIPLDGQSLLSAFIASVAVCSSQEALILLPVLRALVMWGGELLSTDEALGYAMASLLGAIAPYACAVFILAFDLVLNG